MLNDRFLTISDRSVFVSTKEDLLLAIGVEKVKVLDDADREKLKSFGKLSVRESVSSGRTPATNSSGPSKACTSSSR
jgi:hypothetical protein